MARMRKDLIALKLGAGTARAMRFKCRLCPFCGLLRGQQITTFGVAFVKGRFYFSRYSQRCFKCGGEWFHVYDDDESNYGILRVQPCE